MATLTIPIETSDYVTMSPVIRALSFVHPQMVVVPGKMFFLYKDIADLKVKLANRLVSSSSRVYRGNCSFPFQPSAINPIICDGNYIMGLTDVETNDVVAFLTTRIKELIVIQEEETKRQKQLAEEAKLQRKIEKKRSIRDEMRRKLEEENSGDISEVSSSGDSSYDIGEQ